jgi:hypothetical protein
MELYTILRTLVNLWRLQTQPDKNNAGEKLTLSFRWICPFHVHVKREPVTGSRKDSFVSDIRILLLKLLVAGFAAKSV